MGDIAEKIQTTKELLQNAEELSHAVVMIMKSPVGILGIFLFIGWLIFTKDLTKLLELFDRTENKKISRLNEYVTQSHLAESSTLEVVKCARDAYYFKSATGLFVESAYSRKELISLKEKLSPAFSWKTLKRAYPYIKFEADNNLRIDIPVFEQVACWYSFIIGYASLLVAMALTLLVILMPTTWEDILLYSLLSVLSLVFAFLSLIQTWPVVAAKRLRKEYADYQTVGNNNEPNNINEG